MMEVPWQQRWHCPAMALAMPAHPHDMLNLPGVGQAKLDRYGDAFLAVLALQN